MDRKARRKTKIALSAATLAALSGAAVPAYAVTAQVSAIITIQRNVNISATRTLDFGTVLAVSKGTIAVSNTDAVTTTGGVTSTGGAPQAGGFKLIADTGRVIVVTAAKTAIITETAVGAATMAVNKFTVNAVGPINKTPFTTSLTATTKTGFRVGGTLNVGAGQTLGTYTGSVTLTAVYQ